MATISLQDWIKTIKPGMLGPDGKFLGPQAGVNYQFEGMYPEQVYQAAIAPNSRFQGGEGGSYVDVPKSDEEIAKGLDANWRSGPDNGGGFIGSMGRSASDFLKSPIAPVMLGMGAYGLFGPGAMAASGSSASVPASQMAGSGMVDMLGGVPAAVDISGIPMAAGMADLSSIPITAAGAGTAGLVGATAGNADKAALFGDAGYGSTGATAATAGSSFLDKAGNFLSEPSNLLKIGGTVLGAIGGAAASKDSTTTQNSIKDPWAPAQPYLLDNLKTNANAQEFYRQNPFSDLQKQQYQGLFNSLANNQANVPGLLANASAFGQSKGGVMPAMTGLLSGTQAPPIDWTQYQNIGRRG